MPKKSGATIGKIAKEAGVSTATVSRVFNRSGLVRQEVVERILRIAEAKKFTPRQASRRDTLVLVIEDGPEATYTSYAATILKELVHLCAQRHLRLDIVPAEEANLVRGKYILGAIALLWDPVSLMRFEKIAHAPLIAINAQTSVTTVCADEAQGMLLAVDYLASRGHRRIGLIVRDLPSFGDRERALHFDSIMKQRAADGFLPTKIVFDGTSNDLVVGLAKTFRRGRPDGGATSVTPTALIATSEQTGIQLMHDLDILGMHIPADVSVISHEAPEQSAFLLPPQTTVSQDFRAIVDKAVDYLASHPRPSERRKIVVPWHLIERESVDTLPQSRKKPA